MGCGQVPPTEAFVGNLGLKLSAPGVKRYMHCRCIAMRESYCVDQMLRVGSCQTFAQCLTFQGQ